ncbi:MAG: hypothetical protein AAF840_08600, partial [Bacteroidota bacterium]
VLADVNADGQEDLITAGNKFEVEIETTRADASLGTVLLNRGHPQNMEALTPAVSGLSLPENVKGLYPIKLGQNASPGLLVATNDGPLRILEW